MDETVVFHRLGKGDLRAIVDIQLERFEKRLRSRGMKLEITDAAEDFLAEVGYDPTFGARPLKRAIQRHLENQLAEDILGGVFGPGDRLRVDRKPGGELTIGRSGPETVETGPDRVTN